MSLLSKIRVRLHLLLAFLLIASLQVAWVVPAKAQVSGATLSWLVTDEQGGPVANATISVKNAETGVARDVTSNSDGIYSAPNLLPGEYEVTVTATGFQTLTEKGITLTVGGQQSLNLVMKVGALSQTVEVNAAIPDIQTTSSTVSSTVDSTTMRELPLNGRDWTSLATLEPGVSSIPNQVGTGFSANKGNRGFGNQLSNSGHRANENTYRVNGVSINDYSNGSPGGASGLNLGVDGIQEFSVLTSNYTAEYGRTSGAVINAITKSGTNELHGTAFLFDRDKIFDAKNFFDPVGPIPPFRRVQFGGSVGTAIVKDKTFVYGTYEGVRQNQPLSKTIRVPDAAARAQAVPAVVPHLNLWPVAPAGAPDTNGIQSFNVSLPAISKENYVTARVDQKLSANDNLAGNYFWDSGPLTQPDPLQNTVHSVFSRRQAFSLEETHSFSSQLVNSVRLGVSRVRGDINLPVSGDAVATSSGLAVAPGAAAPPEIRVTGLTTAIWLGGLDRFLHCWTFIQGSDDAFWTHGTHAIKMGFAFERMQYNVLEQLSPNGRMNTYSGLAQLLSNTPKQLNALAPGHSNPIAIRESLFAGYIQDDWRFRPNITLNIGLRYRMTTLQKDANNRIEEITTLTNCATPGIPRSPSSPCGPVHVGSFIAGNPTTKNFEPRIGFSWDPFKNGKTAVRGAFGMFDVLPLPYEFGLNAAATAPYQIIGLDGPGGTAAAGKCAADPCKGATLSGGIDNNVGFSANAVRNRFVEQNPKRAYVMNWNFNIQREIAPNLTAIVGYVGSRSLHLSVAADDINLVPPVMTSAGILIPKSTYQLDPNWGGANGGVTPGGPGGTGIRPVIFDGEATYHGLQAQLKRSMSHGVQGQLSYTFSKCRDTSSAPVTGDTYVNSIAVPLLLSKQYRIGACDFDLRHVLVGTFLWDVPGPKSGMASYLAGGWELGAIVTAENGSPYTVTVGGGNDLLGTGFNGDFSMDYADLISGCNATPGVTRDAKGVFAFNPNCFRLPQSTPDIAAQCVPVFSDSKKTIPIPGTCSNFVGNSGRNRFYGPGLTTVGFSTFKNV